MPAPEVITIRFWTRMAYGAEIRQAGQQLFVLAGNLAALVHLCRSFEPDIIHAHMM
jgi:hypothetical protein